MDEIQTEVTQYRKLCVVSLGDSAQNARENGKKGER